MKDFYQTLGLAQNASLEQIKIAYKNLTRRIHPDRGGNGELMGLINEAYSTLADPDKRKDFDKRWQTFQQTNEDVNSNTVIKDQIDNGSILPFSHAFRQQHEAMLSQYEQNQLEVRAPLEGFASFKSDIYQIRSGKKTSKFDDIFSYITEKKVRAKGKFAKFSPPNETLTPEIIITLFTDFLSGHYFGKRLESLKKYLSIEISKIKIQPVSNPILSLFNGIYEIISVADDTTNKKDLILSLKKITDFAKYSDQSTRSLLIPLFYNKYFRNLFSYALHLYWESAATLFNKETLQQFDGQDETRKLCDVLRVHLSSSRNNEGLINLIKYMKLLSDLEKELYLSRNIEEQSAAKCREKAFDLLDWIPVLSQNSSKHILVNILLQIGINFQQAAIWEDRPAVKMADERLALKIYMTVISLSHHSTPNVELYANIQVLKYLNGFQFKDPFLEEVISTIQSRTIAIGDIFPFFEEKQSNVAFLNQEENTLNLMRQLLNFMVEILEKNKSLPSPIPLEQSAVTTLYQAYEACLKNWYQERFEPSIEYKFRLELMNELLAENSWDFSAIEKNLSSPDVMVKRDQDGWLDVSNALPGGINSTFEIFKSINGAEINHKTGEIVFFLNQWDKKSPDVEKSFTLFDIQEMLEKCISGAIFSLDPVDPHKTYHPFNLMRFAPDRLYETEFLNTLLLTDYILKFLTTGQEVQGKYPFDQRSANRLIAHLPKHLKQIIDVFHQEQHSGATHRFWIEAEEVDVILSAQQKELTRINLGEVKMVVKKHRMERDIHGQLKDIDNESEGWPIYILNSKKVHELKQGLIKIEGHALVFIQGESRVLFWEHNKTLLDFIPKNFQDSFVALYEQKLEENGRVIQNSKNIFLLYQVTRELCSQAGMSHRYTAEFIFSYELTHHYDELAQYIPEFGRLKQLSKLSSMIRMLNNMRQANKDRISAIDYLLTPDDQPEPEAEAYHECLQMQEHICKAITEQIREWQHQLSRDVLLKNCREKLQQIRKEAEPFVFEENSSEVLKICRQFYDEALEHNQRGSANTWLGGLIYPFWQRFSSTGRSIKTQIAAKLTEIKQENYKRQFIELFTSLVSDDQKVYVPSFVNSFIRGNIDPLTEALIKFQRIKAIEQISEKTSSDSNTVTMALNGSDKAVSSLVDLESCRILNEQKEAKKKLEEGFVEIGMGDPEESVELTGKCLWVPASVRHEVHESSSSRQLLFVYGGVSVQPKLNITHQTVGPNGEQSRNNQPPATRYTAAQLNEGLRKSIPQGNRKEILRAERLAATSKNSFADVGGSSSKKRKFTQDNLSSHNGGNGSGSDGSGSSSDEDLEARSMLADNKARTPNKKKSKNNPSTSSWVPNFSSQNANRKNKDRKSNLSLINPMDLKPTHQPTYGKNKLRKFIDKISKEGILEPIKIVEHDGVKYVVDGHHRLYAARSLKLNNVPIEKVTLPYGDYKTTRDLIYSP